MVHCWGYYCGAGNNGLNTSRKMFMRVKNIFFALKTLAFILLVQLEIGIIVSLCGGFWSDNFFTMLYLHWQYFFHFFHFHNAYPMNQK